MREHQRVRCPRMITPLMSMTAAALLTTVSVIAHKALGCSTYPWRALFVPPRCSYLSSTRGLLLRVPMSCFALPSLEP